jgi:hypothetical protein
MPDFDLDSLKKTWQQQPVQPKYNDSEILRMLNKRSRNYMKYIFWISAAEFLFFTILGLYYIVQSKESDSFLSILKRLGVEKDQRLEDTLDMIYLCIKIISLLVTGYFVVKFYQNYRKIKVQEDLKLFITRIIQFKKTVNAFIIINLALLVIFSLALTAFVIYTLQYQNIELSSETTLGFVLGLMISTVLCILLLWLYYRLVYGIIMKRLDKNLSQLKSIDANET